MITAKNYAAQAERSLFDGYSRLSVAGLEQEAMAYFHAASFIEDAVKFVVPDGGRILADGLRGIEGDTIRLPFDEITVEYYRETKVVPKEDTIKKSLVLCSQNEDKIFFRCSWFFASRWWLIPLAFAIDCANLTTGKLEDSIVYPEYPINDGVGLHVYPFRLFGKEHENDAKNSCGVIADVRVVLELIEALSCRNVSTANYQNVSPVNDKRVKGGKIPFYETKMLVVDTNGYSKTSGEYLKGSHASPRQHLRRGHIRRLPKGNIWVNSCVVGDPRKGFIEKSYSVK